MRTSLAILNIDRGLAYRGVSGKFECLVSLRMGICGPVWLSSTQTEVWPNLKCTVSLRMVNMRTSLVLLNIDRSLAYLGVSGEFKIVDYAASLAILNIDRGLACIGVFGVFENGEYVDQSGYPQHRQRSGLLWSVW